MTLDGLTTAWHLIARARDALDRAAPTAAARELERAAQQYLALQSNFRTASERAETGGEEAAAIGTALAEVRRTIEALEQNLRQLIDPAD